MATWPTVDEIKAQMHADGLRPANVQDVVLVEALAATIAKFRTICPESTVLADEIPDELRLAAIIQARRWYLRKDTPNGAGGGTTDFGPIFADRGLDNDVKSLIRPYHQHIFYGAV